MTRNSNESFKSWLLGECANSCTVSGSGTSTSINEAEDSEIETAQAIVGGELVSGKGLQFASKEEVLQAKQTLDDEGLDSYTGNRNPLLLFIGKPNVGATGKYGMGPFAADVLKGVKNNPSAKAELDKLVKEKGKEPQEEYTGADLEDIFSRMELKKYSKIIPAVPNTDEGEEVLDRGEQDEKTIEFMKMFPEYDNAVDLILDKFKAGEVVCPYVRAFLKKQWLVSKNDILSVAKTNKLPNYDELEIQIQKC